MVSRPNARSRLPRVLLLSACFACGLLYIFSARQSLLRHHSELASAEANDLSHEITGIKAVQLLEVGLPSTPTQYNRNLVSKHWHALV